MQNVETPNAGYRGKSFDSPELSDQGTIFTAKPLANFVFNGEDPIHSKIDSIYDMGQFAHPKFPIEVDYLSDSDLEILEARDLIRVLDMPIKFPGSNEYRIPEEIAALAPILKRVANYEAALHPSLAYYCYLTVDFSEAEAGATLREAPCHVDGFQGARWNPKVALNHTYTAALKFKKATL